MKVSSRFIGLLLLSAPGTVMADFLGPLNVDVGIQPSSIVVADLRGSGTLDLVTADLASGSISVLLGNGDGSPVFARQMRTEAVANVQ